MTTLLEAKIQETFDLGDDKEARLARIKAIAAALSVYGPTAKTIRETCQCPACAHRN